MVAPAPPDDTLSLVVGGFTWTGWEEIRVTAGVERVPRGFELVVTEKFPGQAAQIDVQPGQPCVIKLGADIVVTGYIDRYAASIGPDGHAVHIQGRSKAGDIVDCAAGILDNTGKNIAGQIMSQPALGAVQLLLKPFGLTASSLSGPGSQIFQLNIIMGETVWELAERICRWSALLIYDGADGNLILSQVGATQMASGFAEGVNVQSASVSFSMDERFSLYLAAEMNVNPVLQLGGVDGNVLGVVVDPTMPRFRPRIIVSEQLGAGGQPLALQRANWEFARRIGRSQAVTLTVDTWRDSAGTLWAPNALAPVNLPSLKLTPAGPWAISEVSFVKSSDRGTVAELVMMPPEAFVPQPDIQYPFDWQVAKAIQDANANAASGAAGR
jgi:prophage tail gpP-like protein